jgi:hypothetical protein
MGINPSAPAQNLFCDITKPSVNLVMDGLPAFSPDGDGQRDNIPFLQSGSEEVNWVGEVISADRQYRGENPKLSHEFLMKNSAGLG